MSKLSAILPAKSRQCKRTFMIIIYYCKVFIVQDTGTNPISFFRVNVNLLSIFVKLHRFCATGKIVYSYEMVLQGKKSE
jgi:hypothetical protein